jgi:hypothetical protein
VTRRLDECGLRGARAEFGDLAHELESVDESSQLSSCSNDVGTGFERAVGHASNHDWKWDARGFGRGCPSPGFLFTTFWAASCPIQTSRILVLSECCEVGINNCGSLGSLLGICFSKMVRRITFGVKPISFVLMF